MLQALRDLRDKALRRAGIIGEVFGFLKARKAWFLVPLVVLLMAVAFIFFIATQPAVTPFVYTLF